MSSDYTFVGRIRRPGERSRGEEVRIRVEPRETHIELGSHHLGSWPNEAVRVAVKPPILLNIVGELWEFAVDDPALFLEVADAYFTDEPHAVRNGVTAAPTDSSPRKRWLSRTSLVRNGSGHEDGSDPNTHTPPESTDPPPAAEPPPVGPPVERQPGTVTVRRWTVPDAPWATTTIIAVIAVIAVVAGIGALIGDPRSAVLGMAAGAVATVTWMGTQELRRRQRPSKQSGPRASADTEARLARALAEAFTGGSSGPAPNARSHPEVLISIEQSELTRVRGVGPQFARILEEAGIRTLEDLAGITQTQRTEIEAALGSHSDRIDRERWIEQAAAMVTRRRRPSG